MPRSARLDPRFGWVQGPGARFVQSAEGWGEFRADADGFLDRPLPPPGRGVRAVLLGDSFGQGLQVLDRERFSEVAEHLMPGLHVLNTAAAGRSAFHHALLAPRLEDAFAPDLVLVQLSDAGELTTSRIPEDRADALAEFRCRPARARARGPVGAGLARPRCGLGASRLPAHAVEKLTRQERQRLALSSPDETRLARPRRPAGDTARRSPARQPDRRAAGREPERGADLRAEPRLLRIPAAGELPRCAGRGITSSRHGAACRSWIPPKHSSSPTSPPVSRCTGSRMRARRGPRECPRPRGDGERAGHRAASRAGWPGVAHP